MDAEKFYKELSKKYDFETAYEIDVPRLTKELFMIAEYSSLSRKELEELTRLLGNSLNYSEREEIANKLYKGIISKKTCMAMIFYDLNEQQIKTNLTNQERETIYLEARMNLENKRSNQRCDDFQKEINGIEHIGAIISKMHIIKNPVLYQKLEDIMHETTSDITKTIHQHDN